MENNSITEEVGEIVIEGATEEQRKAVEYINRLKKAELEVELEKRNLPITGRVSELRTKLLLQVLAKEKEKETYPNQSINTTKPIINKIFMDNTKKPYFNPNTLQGV